MFEKKITIKSYDVDFEDNLKVSSMMKYFQQIARENLDELGITYRYLLEQNIIFVLNKYSIKINSKIHSDDKLLFKTSPCEIKGPSFIRDFIIQDIDGNRLVEASSSWVIIDYKKRTILRPAALPSAIPQSQRLVDFYPERTNVLAGDLFQYKLNVSYSHLDTNKHMNNCIYFDLIYDGLFKYYKKIPDIKSIDISYEHEVFADTNIVLCYTEISNQIHVKCLNSDNNTSCFSAILHL